MASNLNFTEKAMADLKHLVTSWGIMKPHYHSSGNSCTYLFSKVFNYAIIFQLNLVSLFIEIEGEPLRVEYDDHTHTPSRMYGVQSGVVECVS